VAKDATVLGAAMRERMADCAGTATVDEDLFWERTGIKESGWLEAERAGIDV
jgi:hypothetical protein